MVKPFETPRLQWLKMELSLALADRVWLTLLHPIVFTTHRKQLIALTTHRKIGKFSIIAETDNWPSSIIVISPKQLIALTSHRKIGKFPEISVKIHSTFQTMEYFREHLLVLVRGIYVINYNWKSICIITYSWSIYVIISKGFLCQ